MIEKFNQNWFHRYPARFNFESLLQIYTGILERINRKPRNILDPFAGTGSVLSMAKQLGVPSYGKELTKLGFLISKVRLNPINIDFAFRVAVDLTRNYKIINFNYNERLIKWLGKENVDKLNYLKFSLNLISDQELKDWLTIALSSSLRPSSIWLPGSIKPQIDKNREYTDIFSHFIRCAKKLKNDCLIESNNYKKNCVSKIYFGDSKSLEFKKNSIDIVITSPPYGSMYDYYDVHRLSYLAFDWMIDSDKQIGRSTNICKDGYSFKPPRSMTYWYYDYYRGEEKVEGRAIRDYFQSMEIHLKEIYRIVSKNGVIAYAVANSIKNNKKYLLADAVAELIENVGFRNVETILRDQSNKRILPAGRNPFSGRFDSKSKPIIDEYIIYATK